MHDTAMELGGAFFKTYVRPNAGLTILEIGSQDVNGSLREVASPGSHYIGADFVSGRGVDLLLTDPYVLPLDSGSVDVVVSSSCFEHCEFFWILFLEIQRVLRPQGLFYLNVPSNGDVHRFPVDCWRFYPDSGIALQNWGRRNGYETLLLESFTGRQRMHVWNDFVAVFGKTGACASAYAGRIQSTGIDYTNGYDVDTGTFNNPTVRQEDQGWNIRKRALRSLSKGYASLRQFVRGPRSSAEG